MRIAIAGTYCSGKTTLIEALGEQLKGYESFQEPYLLLEEDGHEFHWPPTVEEYEEQLKCAVDLIEGSGPNSIFDGSPIDFLAYAAAQAEIDDEDFDAESWHEAVEEATASLDLIIFLGIETPDRMRLDRSEDPELRLRVDDHLRSMLVGNSLNLLGKTSVVEVSGDVPSRIKSAIGAIQRLGSHAKRS